MKYIIVAFFLGILFTIPRDVQAADPCPFDVREPTPLSLSFIRFSEKILPFFLMGPPDQIRFSIHRANYHRAMAQEFLTDHPYLGYQELQRGIHNLTLLEKPIRKDADTGTVSYASVWKTIADMEHTLTEYQALYHDACAPQINSASDFLSRDKKTLKKIYYESLLVKTPDDY